MLDITRNITGYSKVTKDGKEVNVVYMNATIYSNKSSNNSINKNVLNNDLYLNYKDEVRKDMQEFENTIHAIEDNLN